MQNKFWFVAVNEYKRRVLNRKFLISLFSIPLLLGVSILAGFLASQSENSDEPVGYVDMAGVFADPQPIPDFMENDDPVTFLAYADENAAKTALENGDIQAYYVLPADYEITRDVSLVYLEEPGENAKDDFFDFLQANITADLPQEEVERALAGFDITVSTPDGKRSFGSNSVFDLVLPILAGFLFTFVVSTSSGYLTAAVAEEKENRTIEVLTTSMSANQFIVGKVIGIVMVVATQLFSWLIFLIAAFFGARALFDFEWLQNAHFNFGLVGLLMLIFIPAYFFFAGITLTISSTVTETSEGQQMIGIVTMPVSFSYFFSMLIISNPSSPVSVLLSMIPFTAPTIMPIRAAVSNVPLGQMIASIAIIIVSAIFTIWLAARAYELGMLRFGKRLRLADLVRGNGNGKK